MTEEEKRRMLLEERYATVRVQVRQAYDKCRFMQAYKRTNDNSIKLLESKKNRFNHKKVQRSIDEILEDNVNVDVMIKELKEYLKPLAEEMEQLEAELGTKADLYYGREEGWWKR